MVKGTSFQNLKKSNFLESSHTLSLLRTEELTRKLLSETDIAQASDFKLADSDVNETITAMRLREVR